MYNFNRRRVCHHADTEPSLSRLLRPVCDNVVRVLIPYVLPVKISHPGNLYWKMGYRIHPSLTNHCSHHQKNHCNNHLTKMNLILHLNRGFSLQTQYRLQQRMQHQQQSLQD